MDIVRNLRRETLLLVVLCLGAFFVNNSTLPTDVMEAKNIVTAREVVAESHWLAPTMNGESRIGKPPLAVWVSALVEQAYPNNLSAQRSICGLMATIWALFFFGVARYMERRRGFAEIATFVFLTCYNVIYFGRQVNRDVYGYAFMMAGIYFLSRLFYDERYYPQPHTWRWALLAGLMTGLSILGNGSVAVYSMLLPFLIAVVWRKKPRMTGKWKTLVALCAVALVTFGWWYLYLFLNHRDAVAQALESERDAWFSGHVRPWYYYWRFFTEMGIWAIFTLAALAVPYWNRRVSTKRPYQISITWLLSALLLLSIMPQKNMTDLLSLAPACSLAVACLLFYFIEKRKKDKWAKALFSFNGYVVTLIAIGVPVFVHIRMTNWDLIDWGTALFLYFFLTGIAIYIGVSTGRKDTIGIIRGILALFFVIECFMLGAIGGLFGNSHNMSVAILQKSEEYGQLPMYHSADEAMPIQVVYEANKSIKPLDLNDEQAVKNALPCLVLTQKSLAETMPARVLEIVDTVHVGIFDDNTLPRHHKHYSKELVNRVSFLKAKETEPGH